MELPVTAGFNTTHFSIADKVHTALSSGTISAIKPVGILWHTKLLRKIYLSPELTHSEDMNTLVNICLNKKYPVIHMYLHSSSLIDGATGLLNIDDAFGTICTRISAVVSHLQEKADLSFCTITEAATRLKAAPAAVQTCAEGQNSHELQRKLP